MKFEWFKLKEKLPEKNAEIIFYYPTGHVSKGNIGIEFVKNSLTGEDLYSALWTYPPDIEKE